MENDYQQQDELSCDEVERQWKELCEKVEKQIAEFNWLDQGDSNELT